MRTTQTPEEEKSAFEQFQQMSDDFDRRKQERGDWTPDEFFEEESTTEEQKSQETVEKASYDVDIKKKMKTKKKFQFNPVVLRDQILNDFDLLTVADQLYIYKDGIFHPNGEDVIAAECANRLGIEARPNRISDTLKLIKIATYTKPEELNPNPYILIFKNTAFDLRTQKPIDFSPEHKATIKIPVTYDATAKPEQIQIFLHSVLPGDCINTAIYLFGYTLTRFTFLQKAVVLTGTGSNGKTTFLNLLERFIGKENTAHVSLHQLAENRFAGYDLYGKILNTFDDLEKRAIENTSMFKICTGESPVRAEQKYSPAFSFYPFAKFFFSANEMPTSSDRTYAYYRRWLIIPFPYEFANDPIASYQKKADPDILEKITTEQELSGLLNLALTALKNLLREKHLETPKSAMDALHDYKSINDNIAAFVDDCCKLDDTLQFPQAELYEKYLNYCENEKFKAVSKRTFYRSIESNYPVTSTRIRDGEGRTYVFRGIQYIPDSLF